MRIIADSSCDLTPQMKADMDIQLIPLTMYVGDHEFRDDENLNLPKFMETLKNTTAVPRSACPSPNDFYEAFKEKGSVFVVTMTSALSGTYNSAMMAKQMMQEEDPSKVVHVFDTKGSSVKETLMALKLDELISEALEDQAIIEKATEYLDSMTYLFQLGNLDTMIKNGRIGKFKGIIANALSIRPILKGDDEGREELVENVRTEKKSIKRFVELIGEMGHSLEERTIGISHCNAYDKAMKLKDEVMKKYPFKKAVVVETGGLSSMYMNEGGITVAF